MLHYSFGFAFGSTVFEYEDDCCCETFVFLQDHGDEIPDSPLGIGIWPVPL